MEKIKCDLSRYKTKNEKACATEWQEFAKKTIEEFNISKPYQPIIWKHAKNNLAYLKAKVLNLKETADYKGEDIRTYNRLLIWSLKKKTVDKSTNTGA